MIISSNQHIKDMDLCYNDDIFEAVKDFHVMKNLYTKLLSLCRTNNQKMCTGPKSSSRQKFSFVRFQIIKTFLALL